ncbi:MAG: thermonuclease family protein [Acidimicrobiia bacterium]
MVTRRRVVRRCVGTLCVLLAGCGTGEAGTAPPGPGGNAIVVRPVDGDTLVVEVEGTEERLRLIGIDTPESVAQDRPVECYGPESKARTAELLPAGTAVTIERDVEARDRYGRLLGYVTRADDGLSVNLVLVEEGAAIARSYPPNTTRDGELRAAQSRARSEGRGLWGACGGPDVPLRRSRRPVEPVACAA